MDRPLYYVERFNGERWIPFLIAPYQIGPKDVHGPESDKVPPSETPGNTTAFTGLPGLQARVRVGDTVVELFNWEPIPVNPLDPQSDIKWGWKSVMRNYQAVPPGDSGPLSFLG